MKKELAQIYKNSFLYEIILWISSTLLPRLKYDFLHSRTLILITWFEKNIINSKYLEFFFNPNKVTEAWYASAFYKYTTFGIRRLAFYIPRASLKFHPFYLGFFLLFVLLFPSSIWENYYMIPAFGFIAVLYISHHATQRTGIIFMLINMTIFLFIGIMSMSIPFAACRTLSYFLLAVDLFFLISFAIRTQEDLDNILMFLFVAMVTLCIIGMVQEFSKNTFNLPITGVFGDSLIFSEILILLFPFAFVYPSTIESGIRRFLYSVLVMSVSFWVISATQSRSAFIAYFVELLIVIILINRRYIPIILFLAPTFTARVIENITKMWQTESASGNFFQNIVATLTNFWKNGFGVSTDNFVNMYSSTAGHYNEQRAMISVPNFHINAIYFNILVDIGAIVMFIFMFYILRIAHSSLTCMFRATQKQKVIFAAGLAALIGISVSSMLESNLFEPRVLIMYWSMLGLLRSGRVIRLGVWD